MAVVQVYLVSLFCSSLSRRLKRHRLGCCKFRLNLSRCENMIKNPKLAKHVADANWGEMLRQLKYKGSWGGRKIVEIDRFFPSTKRCSEIGCGFIHDHLPLSVRHWTCPKCGSVHDRDINAAKNIKTAGQAVLASGAIGAGLKAA